MKVRHRPSPPLQLLKGKQIDKLGYFVFKITKNTEHLETLNAFNLGTPVSSQIQLFTEIIRK